MSYLPCFGSDFISTNYKICFSCFKELKELQTKCIFFPTRSFNWIKLCRCYFRFYQLPWPGRKRRRTSVEIAPAWRISLLLQSHPFRSFCAPVGWIKYVFSPVRFKTIQSLHLVNWQYAHTWNIFFSAPLCLMYSLGKNSFRLEKKLQHHWN